MRTSQLGEALERLVNQMLEEHESDPSVKLTYPALAVRAGVSLSTVNQPQYRATRQRLKAGKPERPGAQTNEDAAEWRRRYHQLQKEKATSEAALRDELKEAQATIDRLVQKLQATAVTRNSESRS